MFQKEFFLFLAIIAIILLFGPSRIAGLGGAIGKSMREFKEATKPEEPKATPGERPSGSGTKT
jgi:TatA/E family protein of Tat protein translocase